MKIVHVCLANFYIENMEYQENVLPRKHKELGYDVTIIASQYSFGNNGQKYLRPHGEYINKDGIKVVIIPYLTLTRFLNKSLRLYSGLYEKLCNISPDIIFIHGTQSYSMFTIIKYKINHKKVRLFADQHGDFYNMPLSTIKQKLINKYIAGIPPRIIVSVK